MIGVAVYLVVVVAYSALLCGHQGEDWPPGWAWRRWRARRGRQGVCALAGAPNSPRRPGRVETLTEPHGASCDRTADPKALSAPESASGDPDPPAPHPTALKPADARTGPTVTH